jgi:tetratricopeptide (TPR) repeat protein
MLDDADMTAPNAKLDFFISYTGQDEGWAEWIAWQLEANGYTTVIQAWDFLPGHNFAVKMQNASVRADRTLGVISPAYFLSAATTAEWAGALARGFDGDRRTYIPIRVEDFHPEGIHRPIVYVDFFGCNAEQARGALLAKLPAPNEAGVVFGAERRKPPSEPPFPASSARVANHENTDDAHAAGAPRAWNIPAATVSFAGREAALAALHERVQGAGRAAVTQAHAVYGLGGIGKTQLVTRYAEMHRNDYDIGWWIRAERDTTRQQDLAALGQQLGLPEAADNDLPTLAAATLAWLSRSSRWLLVIDNAPDLDSAAALVPRGRAGHVLITTRAHGDWQQIGAEPIALDVWERHESVEFLAERTHREEPDAANEIAGLLGDLPLALAQAAGYANTQAITLAGYRDRLINDSGGLLAKGTPHDYKSTVAGTWTLAFEQIRNNDRAARILSMCAYLAPERIPRELLDQAVTSDSSDPLQTQGAGDDAIGLLLSYSLLTPAKDELLDMHRLVQQVIRSKQSQEEQQTSITAALRALLDAFPAKPWEPTAWPAAARLLAHAIATTDRTQEQHQPGRLEGNLLHRASTYLRARGELSQATDLGQRACETLENRLGSNTTELATALGNLGIVLRLQGDLTSARSTQERALKIKEAVYGPDHQAVATTLTNLGIVLQEQGDLTSARSTQERALKIQEAVYGPDHQAVATTLTNLGIVLRQQGDLTSARSTQERALKIKEAVYGPDHHEVAITLGNLGNVLQKQRDLGAARTTFARALSIFETSLGSAHQNTLLASQLLSSLPDS